MPRERLHMVIKDIVKLITGRRTRSRSPFGSGSRYLRSVCRQTPVDRSRKSQVIQMGGIASIGFFVGRTNHIEIPHEYHRCLPCELTDAVTYQLGAFNTGHRFPIVLVRAGEIEILLRGIIPQMNPDARTGM